MTAAKRTAKPKRINVAELKAAAAGRELDILRDVAGIAAGMLDGGHHPCPKCGGHDRFSLIDSGKGAVICRGCFDHDNGDFIGAIRWMTGCTFPEALHRIAEYLGMPSDPAADPAKVNPAISLADQFRVYHESVQDLMCHQFAQSKPPITAEAVAAAGGIAVDWPKTAGGDTRCIAFPAVNDHGAATGYILRRVNGEEFPAFGKLQSRKTHMIRNSHDGWVVCGGLDRLRAARVVWKCEGVPDALALHPLLPVDHVAVTNICGAKSVPPFLDQFREKIVYVVADSDRPGQEGAERYAAKLAPIAAEVRVINLPHEVANV